MYRPFEKALLYVVRGKKYLGFWNRFIPNPMLYKFNSIREVNRGGINYSLDLSCMMQWPIYWDLREKAREKLYSLIQKDDVVFDVGTNIGETLLNFAKLTGEKGYAFGFEPDEENYKKLQKNISLNNFSNIHVFKNAVSDKKETVKLYCVDPHNRGMNRILENEGNVDYVYSIVESTTLDEIVEKNNIEKLDLIKIDIEGYEMHALRGAIRVLKRFRPILFVEIGYTRLIKNKTSPNELVKLLEDLGYSISQAETDEKITSSHDFSYLQNNGFDLVAMPSK